MFKWGRGRLNCRIVLGAKSLHKRRCIIAYWQKKYFFENKCLKKQWDITLGGLIFVDGDKSEIVTKTIVSELETHLLFIEYHTLLLIKK